MNLNECAYSPSPKVIEEIKKLSVKINRYPDPNWNEITQLLSNHTGIPKNRIVMGNGSDEAIVAAGRITLEEGAEMVASMPSFPSYYKSALVNGATRSIRDNGASDVGDMLALITDKTKLVFAATPNNPTGGILSEKKLKN